MGGEVHLDPVPLESRPGILFIGSSNVGKRSLLSKLLSIDTEDVLDSSSQVMVHGWTINTRYYTADVSVWMVHLDEEFSIKALPMFNQLAALVMVFDMSDLSSFVAIQDWVAHTDLQKFDVLLCIGNKVDLVVGHPVHTEYRKHLQKQRVKDSSIDYGDIAEYGISEIEGSSLLGYEEPSCETRRACLEWCIEHNIEFIETCASNADFDKCLSIDGDLQGVERLYGALSAHMWPGMLLKSGDRITNPSLPEGGEESSEGESDYEIEYEILSGGSAEALGDDMDKGCSSKGEGSGMEAAGGSVEEDESEVVEEREEEVWKGKDVEIEDLERLMSEIGNVRDSLRLMPDFQRREMAANLALKMAAMFGGCTSSDDEDEIP